MTSTTKARHRQQVTARRRVHPLIWIALATVAAAAIATAVLPLQAILALLP